MTRDEFLSSIRTRGAVIAPPANSRDIATTNALLQGMRAAMLPAEIIDLYAVTSGIARGSAYIFGPKEITRGARAPVPSIIDINREMMNIPTMRGKTIFGRNDLFFFAFDAFGTFCMLDSLSLKALRKYDNAYRAMTDCLAAGRI